MSCKLPSSKMFKSLITMVSKNHHTLQQGMTKNFVSTMKQSQIKSASLNYNSLFHKNQQYFFKGKESEGKTQEEGQNQEGADKSKAQEDAKQKTAEKPKEKSQPETFDSLVEGVDAELKKKLQALWKKQEESLNNTNKKVKDLSEQISSLEKVNTDNRGKLTEIRDRLKEELAERDLMRTRFDKELDSTKSYAISKFAKDLLEIPDNLDRALEAAKALEGKGDTLFDGVKATKNILLHVLEKHGIKMLNPKGEKFDPNMHEALFDYPDPKGTPGTVGTVCTVGYRIGDRVLRPAKVGVVRGD